MFKRRRSLICILICLSLLCGLFPLSASAKTVSELQQEIAKYQKELDKLEGNAAEQSKYQNTLTQQISVISDQINVYESQINDLNSKMNEKQFAINRLNDQIIENQEQIYAMQKDIDDMEVKKEDIKNQLRIRMRENYMSSQTNTLDVLLSSQDFGQFISNITYVKKISDHDKCLTNSLDSQVAAINSEKAKLETKISKINADKALINASLDEIKKQAVESNNIKKQMNLSYNSLSVQLKKSNQQSQAIKNAQSKIEKAKKIAQEQLEDATDEINKKSGGTDIKPDSGGYLFPVAQPCYISQAYKGAAHKGIDIATKGRPNKIYASRGGRVIVAMFGYPGSGFGGYGNVVVIDHGDGYATLYGHMSSYCVRAGQNVNRGDYIGNVGNTGQSMGFHCHFELRKNGNHIAPPF